MKRDIENRGDIDRLMLNFYAEAIDDHRIGYIFTDVAKLNLEHHLPIIGDFWETILFQNGVYARHGRNPLQVHGDLAMKTPLLIGAGLLALASATAHAQAPGASPSDLAAEVARLRTEVEELKAELVRRERAGVRAAVGAQPSSR